MSKPFPEFEHRTLDGDYAYVGPSGYTDIPIKLTLIQEEFRNHDLTAIAYLSPEEAKALGEALIKASKTKVPPW